MPDKIEKTHTDNSPIPEKVENKEKFVYKQFYTVELPHEKNYMTENGINDQNGIVQSNIAEKNSSGQNSTLPSYEQRDPLMEKKDDVISQEFSNASDNNEIDLKSLDENENSMENIDENSLQNIDENFTINLNNDSDTNLHEHIIALLSSPDPEYPLILLNLRQYYRLYGPSSYKLLCNNINKSISSFLNSKNSKSVPLKFQVGCYFRNMAFEEVIQQESLDKEVSNMIFFGKESDENNSNISKSEIFVSDAKNLDIVESDKTKESSETLFNKNPCKELQNEVYNKKDFLSPLIPILFTLLPLDHSKYTRLLLYIGFTCEESETVFEGLFKLFIGKCNIVKYWLNQFPENNFPDCNTKMDESTETINVEFENTEECEDCSNSTPLFSHLTGLLNNQHARLDLVLELLIIRLKEEFKMQHNTKSFSDQACDLNNQKIDSNISMRKIITKIGDCVIYWNTVECTTSSSRFSDLKAANLVVLIHNILLLYENKNYKFFLRNATAFLEIVHDFEIFRLILPENLSQKNDSQNNSSQGTESPHKSQSSFVQIISCLPKIISPFNINTVLEFISIHKDLIRKSEITEIIKKISFNHIKCKNITQKSNVSNTSLNNNIIEQSHTEIEAFSECNDCHILLKIPYDLFMAQPSVEAYPYILQNYCYLKPCSENNLNSENKPATKILSHGKLKLTSKTIPNDHLVQLSIKLYEQGNDSDRECMARNVAKMAMLGDDIVKMQENDTKQQFENHETENHESDHLINDPVKLVVNPANIKDSRIDFTLLTSETALKQDILKEESEKESKSASESQSTIDQNSTESRFVIESQSVIESHPNNNISVSTDQKSSLYTVLNTTISHLTHLIQLDTISIRHAFLKASPLNSQNLSTFLNYKDSLDWRYRVTLIDRLSEIGRLDLCDFASDPVWYVRKWYNYRLRSSK